MLKLFERWQARITGPNRRQKPLTLAGRFFLIAMFICGHGLIDNSILPLFAFVTSTFVVALVTHIYYRPRLNANIVEPELMYLGDGFAAQVEIRNLGRRPVFDLHVELVQLPEGWRLIGGEQFLPTMEVGQSLTLEFEIKTIQRGVFKLPLVRSFSTFPFNLFSRTQHFRSVGESVVAPARDSSRFSADLNRSGIEQIDSLGRRRSQASLEYAGSREYQPGNPVRRWDFTSWARLGAPTVCEFVEGRHREAVLIVDCQQIEGHLISASDCFEALLQSVTGTVDSLIATGHDVQLVIVGRKVLPVWAPGPMQHIELLSALARADSYSNASLPELEDEVLEAIRPQAEVHAILSRWDSVRASLLDKFGLDRGSEFVAVVPDLDLGGSSLLLPQGEALL